jgi:hypothetical protein
MRRIKQEVNEKMTNAPRRGARAEAAKAYLNEVLSPRTLQEQFEQRVRSASHEAADWKESNEHPHMALHKRTLEHAKNVLDRLKK